MIFYASALSSYSAKVRVVLCVKGVPFEEYTPPGGGYRSDAYRAIVPMGTLPAIRVGDWVLSESEVINEYLEEQHPEPAMLPSDPQLRARVRFVSRFHDLYLEPRVRALFAHANPAQRVDGQVAEIRTEVERRIQQLAAWGSPQPWLLTPSISLADCGPLVNLELAQTLLQACGQPIEMPTVLRNWHAMASADARVRRALDPWRAATQQWLASFH